MPPECLQGCPIELKCWIIQLLSINVSNINKNRLKKKHKLKLKLKLKLQILSDNYKFLKVYNKKHVEIKFNYFWSLWSLEIKVLGSNISRQNDGLTL